MLSGNQGTVFSFGKFVNTELSAVELYYYDNQNGGQADQDIFKLDLREATVITLYLLPEINTQLIPQLENLKDGSRIVAHEFAIEGIRHDRMITVTSQGDGVPRDIYLYTLPLRRERIQEKSP